MAGSIALKHENRQDILTVIEIEEKARHYHRAFSSPLSEIRKDRPRIRLFANNQMEYRITDHLASVRATLNNSSSIIQVK